MFRNILVNVFYSYIEVKVFRPCVHLFVQINVGFGITFITFILFWSCPEYQTYFFTYNDSQIISPVFGKHFLQPFPYACNRENELFSLLIFFIMLLYALVVFQNLYRPVVLNKNWHSICSSFWVLFQNNLYVQGLIGGFAWFLGRFVHNIACSMMKPVVLRRSVVLEISTTDHCDNWSVHWSHPLLWTILFSFCAPLLVNRRSSVNMYVYCAEDKDCENILHAHSRKFTCPDTNRRKHFYFVIVFIQMSIYWQIYSA